MLKIALHTVEKHRRTARKKLGLTSKGINLQTYLNTLQVKLLKAGSPALSSSPMP
jgi:hypothetical protein